MPYEDNKVHEDAERLRDPDWLKDVDSDQGDRPHSARAAISNAMEGGLTRNEQTLIERGHEDLVRTYRLRFQEAMEGPTVEAVQRITGRNVIGYHSQIVFNPERAFEIFVLDRPVAESG